MRGTELDLDICGLARVRLVAAKGSAMPSGILSLARKEYLSYISPPLQSVDVVVEFAGTSDKDLEGVRSDDRFVVRRDGFSMLNYGPLGKNGVVSVKLRDGSPMLEVVVDADPLGVSDFFERVLNHLVCCVMLRKNCILVHGGAVATVDGSSIALCGGGGSGKTSAAVALSHRGYRFVSDNFVIVRSDGKIAPFRTPLNVFGFNSSVIHSLPRNANLAMKTAEMRIKSMLGFLGVILVTKIHPEALGIPLSGQEPMPLKALYLVHRSREDVIAEISASACGEMLCSDFESDFPLMSQAIREMDYHFPGSEMGRFCERYRSIAVQAVQSCKRCLMRSSSLDNTVSSVDIDASPTAGRVVAVRVDDDRIPEAMAETWK